jgi:hypothetical protein
MKETTIITINPLMFEILYSSAALPSYKQRATGISPLIKYVAQLPQYRKVKEIHLKPRYKSAF